MVHSYCCVGDDIPYFRLGFTKSREILQETSNQVYCASTVSVLCIVLVYVKIPSHCFVLKSDMLRTTEQSRNDRYLLNIWLLQLMGLRISCISTLGCQFSRDCADKGWF